MKHALVPLALASLIAATGLAQAQAVRLVGEFRDWSAYGASEGSDAVCFAMTKPKSVTPQPDGYSQAYLYLTHRPAQGVKNEINLVAGFAFAPGTSATLIIDGQPFSLFTEADAAWLQDPNQNDTLAGAMRAGSTMVIEGTSEAGQAVKETFSLSGATAASKAIDGGC